MFTARLLGNHLLLQAPLNKSSHFPKTLEIHHLKLLRIIPKILLFNVGFRKYFVEDSKVLFP